MKRIAIIMFLVFAQLSVFAQKRENEIKNQIQLIRNATL